ncbi:metallophosphoesterase [Aneurinibacillus sp. Ricciae_BoGa-3]|uniref:metallophosphoesterase family protein n=1 Tax=Aneurinibacillus sp. Ricciae_BoGa-3 TaxID=3022697 RepID=UPI00234003E4|nr:metallophosphoesterase [Aneurinibacillus sp. Ricciae_BoGa-3]WCK54934.1 metallophosphoesterase [Aneurinibacillus sp. Ricciae_BoGa-3]
MKKIKVGIISLLLTATSLIPTAAAANDPGIRFSVISDIHIQTHDTTSQQKLKGALQDIKRLDPKQDALIVNGDLTEGMPADYALLANIMSKNPRPAHVFYTIGNHEFHKAWFDKAGQRKDATFPNGETEKASIQQFLAFAHQKKVYYDEWIRGYHFIFLGSEKYRQSDPKYGEDAYLSNAQLDWLRARFNEGTGDKPVFVFLHQPLSNTVSGTNGYGNDRAIIQHQELKSILEKHPEVVFFTGHTHWELGLPKTLVQDSFTMVNESSVWEPWTANNKPAPGKRSEGLYIEVFGDRILINGRDYINHKWIQDAAYTIPVYHG